jgi:hypothetical protein
MYTTSTAGGSLDTGVVSVLGTFVVDTGREPQAAGAEVLPGPAVADSVRIPARLSIQRLRLPRDAPPAVEATQPVRYNACSPL